MSHKMYASLASIQLYIVLGVFFLLYHPPAYSILHADRSALLWTPVLEWQIDDVHAEGNPFDVEGYVTFTHESSNETHTAQLFYDGSTSWKFRFTPTRTGTWFYLSVSDTPDLNGHSGTISVLPNPETGVHGFLTSADENKWAWQTGEHGEVWAFTPQLVMYKNLNVIAEMTDEEILRDLHLWFTQHGFNGIHVQVFCRWFDLDKERHTEFDTDDPNPDSRTFDLLERLIRLTHQEGGFVHIWKWGDEDRRMTPLRWGINGEADQRLQRYIAARLGPIPGWSLGYGFDLWEWVTAEQLHAWHANMKRLITWPQFIGGRTDAWHTPITAAMTYDLDYVGYETHQPDYDTYVAAIELKPDRPVFMEDRFRVRDNRMHREKDYSLDDTRRGLWRSAMAGGVANIWGYLLPDDDHWASRPYPIRHQIRTYADFFQHRPLNGMVRDNARTEGVCLRRGNTQYLFYSEDTDSIRMDIADMASSASVIAVDTKVPYYEFEVGTWEPGVHTWEAPYRSDWAIAVELLTE